MTYSASGAFITIGGQKIEPMDTYKTRQCCELKSPSEAHGPAVDSCYEIENQPKWAINRPAKKGTMWVCNGEYASQVNFCPVCGRMAKVKIDTF